MGWTTFHVWNVTHCDGGWPPSQSVTLISSIINETICPVLRLCRHRPFCRLQYYVYIINTASLISTKLFYHCQLGRLFCMDNGNVICSTQVLFSIKYCWVGQHVIEWCQAMQYMIWWGWPHYPLRNATWLTYLFPYAISEIAMSAQKWKWYPRWNPLTSVNWFVHINNTWGKKAKILS